MLYISRYVWKPEGVLGKDGFLNHMLYGVVDTDDKVEEVVTLDVLEDASFDSKCKIHGVELWGSAGDIYSILPYQDPNKLTSLQMKTSMFKNVDVVVWKSRITGIKFHPEKMTKPVSIRLSDFANKCESCIFHANFVNEDASYVKSADQYRLTIVLDDKVRFDKGTFILGHFGSVVLGKGGLGVVIDMREMTNNRRAMSVYGQLYQARGDMIDSVIDIPERLAKARKYWDNGHWEPMD